MIKRQEKSGIKEKPVTNPKNKTILKEPNPRYALRGVRHTPQPTTRSQNDVLMPESSPKQESHLTPIEKMNIARTGISKKSLEHLKAETTLDYDKLAKILAVTKATLINKKGNEKFNPSLSERIISLADLYSYGYEVFEDKTRFNKWMFSPSQALGGQTPHAMIDNQFGREEVRNIIGRIEYGVYS